MYAFYHPVIDSQAISDSLTSLGLTASLSDNYYLFKFRDKELRFRAVKECAPGSMGGEKKETQETRT